MAAIPAGPARSACIPFMVRDPSEDGLREGCLACFPARCTVPALHCAALLRQQLLTGAPQQLLTGASPTFPWSRYQLLLNVTYSPEWEAIVAGRDPRRTFLWLPDDDIVASSCDITRFLRVMEAHQLVLAQVGCGGQRWVDSAHCAREEDAGCLPLPCSPCSSWG